MAPVSIRSDDCCCFPMLVPYACSLCSIPLYCEQCQCSSRTVTPWNQGKTLENPSLCEEGAFRTADATWTSAHLAVEPLGKHWYLLFMKHSKGSIFTWPLVSSQGHKHLLLGCTKEYSETEVFKTFQAFIKLHSVTAHMLPSKALLTEIFQVHISTFRIST